MTAQSEGSPDRESLMVVLRRKGSVFYATIRPIWWVVMSLLVRASNYCEETATRSAVQISR